MSILIVPSHHHSPESITPKDIDISLHGRGISKNNPQSILYKGREGDLHLGSLGIMVASTQALDQILVNPADSFSGFNYERHYVGYDYNTRNPDQTTHIEKEKYTSRRHDHANPSRNYLSTDARVTGSGGIALIQKDSTYTKSMHALMEVLGTLPILPVLQASVFDPKYYDEFAANTTTGTRINHEKLKLLYPYGMLAYPKRIWPEFYSVTTGKSILRVSHHPDRENDPHRNAFRTDRRLGELTEGEDIESVIKKFKQHLMPLLEQALEREQQEFYTLHPELKQFDQQ